MGITKPIRPTSMTSMVIPKIEMLTQFSMYVLI
jgi:hypothetical protein